MARFDHGGGLWSSTYGIISPMTQEEAALKAKVRQAIKPLQPPVGVVGSPEVLVERDSDDDDGTNDDLLDIIRPCHLL